MPDTEEALARVCSALPQDQITVTFSRKEIVAQLLSIGVAIHEEEAKQILDAWEPSLLNCSYVADWAVRYNVYTDTFHFDRVLEPGLLEVSAENQAKRLPQILRAKVLGISPTQFEHLLGALFTRMPNVRDVRVTKATRDGGIDFRAVIISPEETTPTRLFGQAKHWIANRVGSPEVDKLIGVLAKKSRSGPVRGVFVSLCGYSGPAEKALEESPYPIDKYGMDDIVVFMTLFGVGTKRVKIDFPVFDPVFWDELDVF